MLVTRRWIFLVKRQRQHSLRSQCLKLSPRSRHHRVDVFSLTLLIKGGLLRLERLYQLLVHVVDLRRGWTLFELPDKLR